MREDRRKRALEGAYIPERIFVDAGVLKAPLTRRILTRLKTVPQTVIKDHREKAAVLAALHETGDPLREGKKLLWLAAQKGKFVKPCPCTPGHVGCRYFTINLNLQCPLDCTYCILQNYLVEPWLTVFVNTTDLWAELDAFLGKLAFRYLRMGTGELGDSLALDHITGLSGDLISYFRKHPNVDFELKTKTTNIRGLLEIDPPRNIVVSWSLNAERMARDEEQGAPSIEDRLEAARTVVERGFRVGFHFDPLIRHVGWKSGYAAVVRALSRTIPPGRIAWISLGSFRFPPPLKKIIQTRFPGSRIVHGEFITGQDGKARYFRPLREELFRHVANLLRRYGGGEVPLYLCMENEDIWRDVLGWKPGGKRAVENALSPRGWLRG